MKKNMITLFKDNNLENKIVAALDLYQYFNVALIISSVTIFQLSKKKRNNNLLEKSFLFGLVLLKFIVVF